MGEKVSPFGVQLKPTGKNLTLDRGTKPPGASKITSIPAGPTRVAALKSVFGETSEKPTAGASTSGLARSERKLSPRTGNGALKTSKSAQEISSSGYSIKKTEDAKSSQFKAFGLTFAKVSTTKQKPKSEKSNGSVSTGVTQGVNKTFPRDLRKTPSSTITSHGELIKLDQKKVEEFVTKVDLSEKPTRPVPWKGSSVGHVETAESKNSPVIRDKKQASEVIGNIQTTEVISKKQTSGIIRQEKSIKSELSLDLSVVREKDNSRRQKLSAEQRTKSFPISSERRTVNKFSQKESKNSKKVDRTDDNKIISNGKKEDVKTKVSPRGAFVTKLIEKCETRDVVQDSKYGSGGKDIVEFPDTLLDKLAVLEGLVSGSSSDDDSSDDSDADDGYDDVATVIECLAEEDKVKKRFVIKDEKSSKTGRLERRLAKRRSGDIPASQYDKLHKTREEVGVTVPDWDTSSGRASMAEEESTSLEDSDAVNVRPHTVIELTDKQAKRLKQRNHEGKPAGTKWKKKWKQFYRRSQDLLDIPGLQSKLENMSLTQLPANVKQRLRDRMKRSKKKRTGQFVVNADDEGDTTDEMCQSSSEDLRSEIEEAEDTEGIYHTIDTLPRKVTPIVSVNVHMSTSPAREKLPISPVTSLDNSEDTMPDLPPRSQTGSAYERYSALNPRPSQDNADGIPSLPPKNTSVSEYNLLNKRNLNAKRSSMPAILNSSVLSIGGSEAAPPLPPRNIKSGRLSLGNLDASVPPPAMPAACTGSTGDSYLRQPKHADKFPVKTRPMSAIANRDSTLLGQVPPPPQKHRPITSNADSYLEPDCGGSVPPGCQGPGLGYLDMEQGANKENSSVQDPGAEKRPPEPFSDMMDFTRRINDKPRPDFEDVEIDLELQVSISRSRYKSRFEREPLYQYYNKDYINRQSWQRAISEEPSSPKSDDRHEYINPEISITISTERAPEASNQPDQLSAPPLASLGQTGTIQRTLWSQTPEVLKSGILKTLSDQEKKEQEAMFEIITSEASYFKSLNVLINNFVTSSELSDVISKHDKHQLFSNIGTVRDTSEKFLADLEARWNESEGKLISDISDIIIKHASDNFDPYVKYCTNKTYQDRIYDHLIKRNPSFKEVVVELQSNPDVQGLPMASFFLLPLQRITRLPLLMDGVVRRREPDTEKSRVANQAMDLLNKLVKKCNEGAKRMEQTEQLCMIEKQLDFKIKKVPLVSSSRFMVKEGELVKITTDSSSKLPFGKNRPTKHPVYLFLFNDIMLVAKKKGENQYSVVDYTKRNSVHVEAINKKENCPLLPNGVPSGCKNVFLLAILENHEGKQVELILSCNSPSDRTRWMEAFTPKVVDTENEKIYEEWDCPQVQAIHSYTATQPDELSLEEADVVNVFRKMADGWYEGERIRDGERGWFPESYVSEILSSHVRARNLRLRYRVLVASKELAQKKS